jgi:hypothetical protein
LDCLCIFNEDEEYEEEEEDDEQINKNLILKNINIKRKREYSAFLSEYTCSVTSFIFRFDIINNNYSYY